MAQVQPFVCFFHPREKQQTERRNLMENMSEVSGDRVQITPQ